ncbi:MAG: MinD/ParA family ATP-binding protein [Aeoliella sp.]
MDLQAGRLRQLVRQVRRAAIVATGPSVLSIVGANSSLDLDGVVHQLQVTAEERGVRVSSKLDSHDQTDWQLSDAGVGFKPDDISTWQRATVVLMVTTTDEQAVLDTYTALKLAARETPLPAIEFLVQDVPHGESSRHVYDRLRDTLERFLDCRPAGLTVISDSDAGQGMDQLIDRLLLLAPAASCSPLATNSVEAV